MFRNTKPQRSAPDQQGKHEQNAQSDPAALNKPAHSGGADHNQYIADPLAHFLAIPWTAKLLTDPAALDIVVSDRSPLASGDKQFVRTILNGATTVRACVTFLMRLPPQAQLEGQGAARPAAAMAMLGHQGSGDGDGGVEGVTTPPISRSRALLQGGGPGDGEDPEKPFLLFNALLDLGNDLCGYKGTLHGGAVAVLLDETMCAAADNQSREFCSAFDHRAHPPARLPLPAHAHSVHRSVPQWLLLGVFFGDG